MLKRFCYVSVGLLALVLAFHLGAAVATSSVDCVEAAGIWKAYGGDTLTIVTSGGIVECRNLPDGSLVLDAPLPRPGTVVECKGGSSLNPHLQVLYADGEMYEYRSGNGWALMYNVACAPVSLQPASWGDVKREFSGDR